MSQHLLKGNYLKMTRKTRIFHGPLNFYLLIIVNILLRGFWILYMQPTQHADFEWYYVHAKQLAEGQGYHWNGAYTAYWPIGWPFILSLLYRITGAHILAGIVLNVVFSIGIVILIYKITRKLFQSTSLAFISALAYSLLPSQIEWNAINGSEESFTFILLLSIYVLMQLPFAKTVIHLTRERMLFLIGSGLLLGFACDIRPIPLLFPLFLLLGEWILLKMNGRITILDFILYVGSMLMGILPVTLRNAIAMHHFILVSTNGGVNLWQGTQINGGYFWTYQADKNPLVAAGNNEILRNQIGEHVALQYFLHHPWLTLINGFIKIFDLYKNDVNAVQYTFLDSHAKLWMVDLMRWVDTIYYWIFMLFFLIAILSLFRQKNKLRSQLFLPLLFILYYTLVFFFFPAWDRFRYPIMPLFAILVGYGIRVCTSLRKKSSLK